MMQRLTLILLSIIALSGCDECSITAGNYASSGGSEDAIFLTLLEDKSFTLVHEEWQPGHYDKRNTSHLIGTWSCKGKQVTLAAQGKQHIAELVTIGKNPMGLAESTQALSFVANKLNADSYLYNKILYPE